MLSLTSIRHKRYWPLWLVAMLVFLVIWLRSFNNEQGLAETKTVDSKASIEKNPASNIPSQSVNTQPVDSVTPAKGSSSTVAATWADTQIDGELKVDADGNLIVDLATRDYLDYMFSAVGELPPEQVLALIELQARQQLPPQAVSQLLELIDDYLAFQESVVALTSQRLKPASEQDRAYYLETLNHTFEQLKLLRRTHMSAEAVKGFFELEEAYSDFTLANMQLQMRDDLTSIEKQQEAEVLRQQLPEGLSRSVNQRQVQQQRQRQTQAVLTSDLSNEAKRQQLSELHSPVMVEQIMSHQQSQQDWQQTFGRYQQENKRLLEENASEEQQQRLLEAYFPTQQEQNIARTHLAIQKRSAANE